MEDIYELSNKTFNRRSRKMFTKHFLVSILVVLFGVFTLIINLNGFRQSQTETGKYHELLTSIMLIGLGIALLVVFFIDKRRREKDCRELFMTYPELDGELANLLEADYIDEDIRVLVYGHHLVSVVFQLQTLDLEQCQFLETVSKTIPHSNGLIVYFIKATLYDGTKRTLTIYPRDMEVDVEERLDILYDYLNTYD